MLKKILNHHTRKLTERAAAVMAGHQRFPFISLATLLHGGSLLYGAAVRIRGTLYDHGMLSAGRVDRTVISIGNLTAGGTGKTPMTVHLAKLLASFGLKVMIVSRGYKSLSEKAGAVVSDGQTLLCDAHTAGDEPYLMARLLGHMPVIVGQKRFETACQGLQRFGPDVILLDDAFQHHALARDINLVLMDADDPVGNGHLLPRGPLREPLSALDRADAIIFTRGGKPHGDRHHRLVRMISEKPVFECRHVTVLRCFVPSLHPIDEIDPGEPVNGLGKLLQGRQVFAFAGLARNKSFFSSVSELGVDVQGTADFSDHHFYSPEDIDTLVQRARQSGCRTLVTTDKDFVRLPKMPSLPMDLVVLGVEIDFGEDKERWERFIRDRLSQCTAPIAVDAHRVRRVG